MVDQGVNVFCMGGFSPKVKEQKAPEGVAVIPKT